MKNLKYLFLLVSFMKVINTFSQDDKRLTLKETDHLIDNIGQVLQQVYFDSIKSKKLIKDLNKRLRKKQFYDMPKDLLLKKLTNVMRENTNDVHFFIGKDKKEKKGGTSKKLNKINYNGGFTEVKILENNIGYIKWDRCIANDEAFSKIKNALEFVKGCEYLVFDISNNPGGDGRSSGFINQHLYKDNSYQKLLVKRCFGEKEWYQSEVPYNYSDGPKFYDIPVYVLVSENTGSAAEYFAFIAQEMKRATILGKKTAGAGNPVARASFGEFFMYIPTCEIKTINEKSIEAKGVSPDIVLTSKDWLKESVGIISKTKKQSI